MPQTITLTQGTGTMALQPVWRATPFSMTGTVGTPALQTWRAQIWRRPQDCQDADAEPLATVYGTVESGTLSIAFSAEQMDIDLRADNGAYDDLWLMVGGVTASGEPHVVVADWLRVKEGGFSVDDYPAAVTDFTVENDVISITYDGTTYQIQAVEADTPAGAGQGSIVVIDDVLYFTPIGSSTSWRVGGVPST